MVSGSPPVSESAAAQLAALGDATAQLRTLRDLYNNLPCGLHSFDAQGRIVEINGRELSWLGLARENVLGKLTTLDILDPADHAVFREALARLQAGESVDGVELRLRRCDGTAMAVLMSANAVTSDQGEFLMAHSILVDITERKRIEEQLRRSDRRYQELVNSIDGVVWELDVERFAFEFVSPQAERLLGYPLAEWYETPNAWVKYLHDDDRDAAIAFCIAETEAKRDHCFEYRMLAADGRVVWLQDIVNVVVENDRPVKLRGVMVDITERRHAEDQRERIANELTRFFDLALDLLCVVGFDGYFKRVNPAFQETLGYSELELLSRPISEFIHPDDRTASTKALSEAAEGSQHGSFENRYLDSDGNVHWLQWKGRLVAGERLLYAAGRDITDSRRHTEEQAALRRIATLVASGPAPELVFEAVATEANALLDAEGTALMRYEPDGSAFVLAQDHHGAPGPHLGTRISLEGDSATSRVRTTGQTARFEGYETVSGSMADAVRTMGVERSVAAPIVVEGRLWGVMVCAWSGGRFTPPDVEEHLARFTRLVGTAVANAASRSELAASRKRIVIAADEERRRIQRNLHDGTQQRLVSAAIELRSAKAMVVDDPPLSSKLGHIADTLGEALEELHDISRGLHPAVLSHGGLEPALSTLIRRSAVNAQLAVDLPSRLPEQLEIAVYYIVSEALTNAAKHAQASAVNIEVHASDEELALVVQDDGVGGADPSRGSGLTGLSDRVEAIGGTLTIVSGTGEGTRLEMRLPVPQRPGPARD